MSNFPSVSKEQKHYLKALKRNLRLIQIARILLLFLSCGNLPHALASLTLLSFPVPRKF